MNGRIWVESEKGKGSRFIFEIDLVEIEENESAFRTFDGRKTLIVDDSSSWHEILKPVLEKFGMKVDSAMSGRDALEKMHECKNRYDVIFMDWDMPELNGIETTHAINRMCENCSRKGYCDMKLPVNVIMISAFRQDAIVYQAKIAGIDIFLQKPINPFLLNDILSGIFYGDGIVHS